MHTTQKGNSLLWLLGLVALGVLAFLIFKSDRTADPIDLEKQKETTSADVVVLEGEVVCLPYRDTSGPTTLECAFGLKTDEGKYYGLDASGLSPEKQGGYDVGQRVAFEGYMTALGDLSENFMTIYNVEGMISIEDYWEYRDK